MQAQTNGITIEYEMTGPENGPVLLMIHGLGAQLIRWPQKLCDQFVAEGFRVLRYDSRDIGLSTHMDGALVPDLVAVTEAKRLGREIELPYTLSDLAVDAEGLLDALDISAAHVLGVSLGGMVAQVLAIEHPQRVLSLAIMMSQSGNPELPPSSPDAIAMLSKPAPDPFTHREDYLNHQVQLNQTLGSPDYPVPESELREFANRTADRAWNPLGSARQLAAARGAPDRRHALLQLEVAALIIHGADDSLMQPACGEDIANNIKGSWLLKINGMGHDLPSELFGVFVASVKENATRLVKSCSTH